MTLIGIITDHNIRKILLKRNNLENIDTIVTKNPFTIDNLDLSLLTINKIGYLYIPVVINTKLIGMVENAFK